jgi:hypothetical protein
LCASRTTIGQRKTNVNGYTYEKTEEGWRPAAEVMVEAKIGRRLASNERVRFKDGNQRNLVIANLELVTKNQKSPAAQLAAAEATIEELQAKLGHLLERKRELEQLVARLASKPS